jgi:dihydrofolate reductase
MRVTLIVAVAENGVIGRDGTLPWRLPADLAFFKRVTIGHHIVMGRRTFESLGRVLPGRPHLVLSRDPAFRRDDVVVLPDLATAIAHAEKAGETELFVIGGASVYEAALAHADRILLTRVHARPEGDVLFPAIGERFVEAERREQAADRDNPLAITFVTLVRAPAQEA